MRDLSFTSRGNNGKGVLLVHGLTGAPGEMKVAAKHLLKRGFSVHAPQLAGHCADQKALLATRWPDWLDSVRTAFAKFSAENDETFVAGICVGGALGLALAAEDKRVAASAVYSMTYRYDGWNMKGWFSAVAPFVQPFAGLPGLRQISFAEPAPFGLKDEVLRARAVSPDKPLIPGALARLPLGSMGEMHKLADHIDRVGKAIHQPTLILHARDDDMSHPRNAERLQRALAGPTELHFLDDCYHMIHVDKQRERVGQLTADFFEASSQGAVKAEQMADA